MSSIHLTTNGRQQSLRIKQGYLAVCWVAEGRGRISFSWDAVAKGVTDNLSVKVLSSEDSLFMNFARDEEYLTTSSCRTVESFTGCPRITTKNLQPETTGTPGVPFNF